MHCDYLLNVSWPERLPMALDSVDDILWLIEGAWFQESHHRVKRDPECHTVIEALSQQVFYQLLLGVAHAHVGQHTEAFWGYVFADKISSDFDAIDKRWPN